AAIRPRPDRTIVTPVEQIVVLGAGQQRAREAGAVLDTLDRGDAHHRLSEIGFELVEHRLAPARRHATSDRADHTAHRVAVFAGALDTLDHFLGGRGIGAADVVRVDV